MPQSQKSAIPSKMGYAYVFCEDFKPFSLEWPVTRVPSESQCKSSRGDENNITHHKTKNAFGLVLNSSNYTEMSHTDKRLMYYITGCKEF